MGDEVRVFDHELGDVSSSKILSFYKFPQPQDDAFTLHFTNDIDVTAVGGHCFFDKTTSKYVNISNENADSFIGHEFYNVDQRRWETLVSVDYLEYAVDTYVVVSEKALNTIANGMLSNVDGLYSKLCNIFEMDENLKIDPDKKAADIEKYGLWTYDSGHFSHISQRAYETQNLQYLGVAIGKGLITPEEIAEAVEQYNTYTKNKEDQNKKEKNSVGTLLKGNILGEPMEVGAIIQLGGSININNNYHGSNVPDNLFLWKDDVDSDADIRKLSVLAEPAPSSMSVGITLHEIVFDETTNTVSSLFDSGAFSENGSANDTKFFKSDDSKYIVEYREGALFLTESTTPPPSGGGGGTAPTPTTGTIGDDSGHATDITISTRNGNAIVSDIPAETINSTANAPAIDGDVDTSLVIDVTEAGSGVTKVTLTKDTVENIASALESENNNKENLVIKTDKTEVILDTVAVDAIAKQATAQNIQIVVENTVSGQLNDHQRDLVAEIKKEDNKEVVQSFEAYVVSGGVRISDFNRGLVTVGKIDYKIPEGKNSKNYHIYYLPEKGNAQRYPTWVVGNTLYFRTSHFSDYIIVYDEAAENGEGNYVYRLYNSQTGDHLFTTSATERDAARKLGYGYEGVGFYIMGTGNHVYRFYNPSNGEHFYTASLAEKDVCIKNGWKSEGIAYITEGDTEVFRLYNGRVHFFTASAVERTHLLEYGWEDEGVGFKAI